jgi:hypothetical protein
VELTREGKAVKKKYSLRQASEQACGFQDYVRGKAYAEREIHGTGLDEQDNNLE